MIPLKGMNQSSMDGNHIIVLEFVSENLKFDGDQECILSRFEPDEISEVMRSPFNSQSALCL